MQSQAEWGTGPAAWEQFTIRHPELGYRPGRQRFHNFLRHHREALLAADAIRIAKRRYWIAHFERFNDVGFECATGMQS
jgi:hypothetical protein